MALGPLLNRSLRDEERVRPDGALQAGTDVLVWPKCPFGVIDAGTDEEGSGLGVERRRGKSDPASKREDRAVDQNDFDDIVLSLGGTKLTAGNLGAITLNLVFGQAEINPHGRENR